MAIDRKALGSWLARLREVLNREWNPIGVLPADDGGNEDEYDRYRDRLASIIIAHATDEELAAYLERAEREWMGLGTPTGAGLHEAGGARVPQRARHPPRQLSWRLTGRSAIGPDSTRIVVRVRHQYVIG